MTSDVQGHTPEPWHLFLGQPPWIRADDGTLIAVMREAAVIANARRIVACVNACAGIPTEELEEYVQKGGALHFECCEGHSE